MASCGVRSQDEQKTPQKTPWRRQMTEPKYGPCERCHMPVKRHELRTYVRDSLRLLLCKECFLKFVAEDVRTGKRQPKLVHQPLSGEQLELPF